MAQEYSTPGIYIEEANLAPSVIAPVETAIPAFVGYTSRASRNGRSCRNVPVKINSVADYLQYFGRVGTTAGALASEAKQYTPLYHPVPAANPAIADISVGGRTFDVEPDPGTIYHLYNSIRLFYANGGGPCYIVSVGTYGAPLRAPKAKSALLVNPHITAAALLTGIAALASVNEITLVASPDAALLSPADQSLVHRAMLAQGGTLRSRIAILDAPTAADPAASMTAIARFRTGVGEAFTGFGAAYFPNLQTTLVPDEAITFRNIATVAALTAVVQEDPPSPVRDLLGRIARGSTLGDAAVRSLDQRLQAASKPYARLRAVVLVKAGVLPPSGAVAGAIVTNDRRSGVWKAPANVALAAVSNPVFPLSDPQLESLNVDPATGRSINAIRAFPARGVLVWGARTLDGNNNEWRYLSIRRLFIMIEQSIAVALRAFAFEPNNASTWIRVKAAVENFLMPLWRNGALMGAKPEQAFSAKVGLGSTMTANDISQGLMIVLVMAAPIRPAEFIVVRVTQKMAPA